MDNKSIEEIYELISTSASLGEVLPVSREDIRTRSAFYEKKNEAVVAYASIAETGHYQMISSVIVHPDFRGQGLGRMVVRQAVEFAIKNSTKPVVAVANSNSHNLFLGLGFQEIAKTAAPEELWGGRTMDEWLTCDRYCMQLPTV